ncbi:MAG: hypothetical protein UEP57_10055 [Oscillospiraceae bacterium]|nr:hypothetical protein [Oscillospiraceae bacterium]
MAPLKEAMMRSARAVSERFWPELTFEKRWNTVCISSFSNGKVGSKDPLTAADDFLQRFLKGSWRGLSRD